jgi:hypothetical protein
MMKNYRQQNKNHGDKKTQLLFLSTLFGLVFQEQAALTLKLISIEQLGKTDL